MSERKLDDWISGFMQYTENSEPPTQFRLWTAISVVAAALERKCYLEWGSLTFFPNMYIVLVGPSGCRKGTAMGPGLKMLDSLGVSIAAESITREALIRELKNCNSNTVMEDTGEVILHSSLTIYSPELIVFLGIDNKQLMNDLTDWWDCRERWTYRTKNMGSDDITNVWVNLLGATTPSVIQTALPTDAIGGGLTSRMIFINARKKAKTVPIPFLTPAEYKLKDDLEYDLEKIHCLRGKFQVSQEFVDCWIEWYTATDGIKPFESNHFHGYFERRPTHLMKLSTILNASRTDSMILEPQDFNRALEFLTKAEETMPYTFIGYGQSRNSEIIFRIVTFIEERGRVKISELAHNFIYDIDKKGLAEILQTLEQSGKIRIVVGNPDTYVTVVHN